VEFIKSVYNNIKVIISIVIPIIVSLNNLIETLILILILIRKLNSKKNIIDSKYLRRIITRKSIYFLILLKIFKFLLSKTRSISLLSKQPPMIYFIYLENNSV
jgi:hypothetical protein